MKKFEQHRGIAAPILRGNVDTDAIIPSREMKRVSKQGLGEGLFAGWRYLQQGGREPNPDFVLNKPEYAGASILLSGPISVVVHRVNTRSGPWPNSAFAPLWLPVLVQFSQTTVYATDCCRWYWMTS